SAEAGAEAIRGRPAGRPRSRPMKAGVAGPFAHVQARDLPTQVPALPAAAAAAGGDAGLLHLAGEPGALPVPAAPGRLRPEDAVRRPGELRAPLRGWRLPPLLPGHRH